jgi:hypothetical protein
VVSDVCCRHHVSLNEIGLVGGAVIAATVSHTITCRSPNTGMSSNKDVDKTKTAQQTLNSATLEVSGRITF